MTKFLRSKVSQSLIYGHDDNYLTLVIDKLIKFKQQYTGNNYMKLGHL